MLQKKTKIVITDKDIKYFLVFFSKIKTDNIIKMKRTNGILFPVIIRENKINKKSKIKYR